VLLLILKVKSMNKINNKNIIFEIISIVVIVAAVLIWIFISKNEMKTGFYALIHSEGKVTRISLDINKTYTISSSEGMNVLTVENGYIYVSEADCPDKICINQGKINKTGETIICLPHELVVEIEGEDSTVVDSKTY